MALFVAVVVVVVIVVIIVVVVEVVVVVVVIVVVVIVVVVIVVVVVVVIVVVVVVVVVAVAIVVVGLIIYIPNLLSLFSSVDSSEATFNLPVIASCPLVVMVWMCVQFVAMRLQLQATPKRQNVTECRPTLCSVSVYD